MTKAADINSIYPFIQMQKLRIKLSLFSSK